MMNGMTENPEIWRKPTNVIKESERYGEQRPLIDSVRDNREKKWFFDTVNTLDNIYFPFGEPGSGAPIRDPRTKKIISRLPHIEENLWKNTYARFNAKRVYSE